MWHRRLRRVKVHDVFVFNIAYDDHDDGGK